MILAVVACLQIYLAKTHELTPWKGGGFGMFSTLDTPGSRFLRAYLLTDEGEVAVFMPGDLGRLPGRLQAMPSQHALDELARELAKKVWVRRSFNTFPDRPQCAEPLPAVCYETRPGCSSPLGPRYRAKSSEEPEPGASDRVSFSAVRLELWREGFSLTTHSLTAVKELEATSPSIPLTQLGRQ